MRYRGRGIGVGIAYNLLDELGKGIKTIECSKDLLRVEALPRIFKSIGVDRVRVRGEEPYLLIDRYGNILKVNVGEYNRRRYVYKVSKSPPKTDNTCVDEEREQVFRDVIEAFNRVVSRRSGGRYEYFISTVPTRGSPLLVHEGGVGGSIKLQSSDGWESSIIYNDPYTLYKLDNVGSSKNVRLNVRGKVVDKDVKLYIEGEGLVLEHKGGFWYKIMLDGGLKKIYSSFGGKYVRVVGGGGEVLKLEDVFLINSSSHLIVETWNSTGELAYMVDFSVYMGSEETSLKNVLCASYGLDGVCSLGIGPLFDLKLEVSPNILAVESSRDYSLRMVIEKNSPLLGPRVISESMVGVSTYGIMEFEGVLRRKKYTIIRTYPITVLPVHVRSVEGRLRVLLWNTSDKPSIARVESSKFIRRATLLRRPIGNDLLKIGKSVILPIPAKGLEWLEIETF